MCIRDRYLRCFEAQLALQGGRAGEALSILRDLATRSALLDTNSLDATVRTRLALAELADGSPKAAWEALEPLIARVVATGHVGQVLVTGVQALTELSLAPWEGAASRQGLAALRQWIEIAQRFKAGAVERPPASAANDLSLIHI